MVRKREDVLEFLQNRKKLSPMELEFMRFIWEHPEGISSEEIYAHFPQARGTKSTILYNISEKGYVTKQQYGLHHFYKAEVSEEEYESALFRQQLKKVFGLCSLEGLFAAFFGKKDVSEKQLEKMKQLVDEMEKELKDE